MSQFEMLLVAGMAAVTFGVRYPVLAVVGRVDLPSALVDAMKFIPPAVLTAIIVPSMLMPNGTLYLSYTNAYLVAGITAAVVAWRTKNLLLTIVIGMVTLWGWRFLTG